uniref:CBM20 domain-containing protein n=1 Tax=Echinostoma caproni TaxID=27848 RepID=A0A183ACJ8_9TREM
LTDLTASVSLERYTLSFSLCNHFNRSEMKRSTVMVGSYGPQKELREWNSETYVAPKGAMHRGTYHVKSRFRDIDKHQFITWRWVINVVKSPSSTD